MKVPSTHLIFAVSVSLAVSYSTSSSALELVHETNSQGIARRFMSPDSGWQQTNEGFGGAATGEWTYATTLDRNWTNYSAEFDLRLVQPADRRDGLELGAYTGFRAMANLGGYEAAALVRYESPERHYRIAVSSLWKEVILWRPSGGVLQVRSFPFEINKVYKLKIECRDSRLTVYVDGNEVIDWWDRSDPVSRGGVGIGRKEGEAYLTRALVKSLPAESAVIAAHVPNFQERVWHDEKWYFDGNEPLFVLTRANVLDHMRLMPGYRPALYAFNYVTDWSQFQPSRITSSKVSESGSRLVLETTAVDPGRKSSITSHAKLVVTFDRTRGMYEYDHSCTTQIDSLLDAEKVSTSWDHGDAVFLGCVGSSQTRDPKAYQSIWKWAVFQAADGKHYKVPLNPNFHYLGKSSTNGGPLRPDGGLVTAIGDPVLSPVIKIPGMPQDATGVQAGLCWWAFDVHTLFSPKTSGGKVSPGSYTTRVLYSGLKRTDSQRLFDEATFYEPLDLAVNINLFPAGIGFTETFDKSVLLATPHSEHRIWAGVLDIAVGHSDRSSLRIDGASEAWVLTGPSYFTSPFGKKSVVSAWVKTKDVQGEGPTIGIRRLDNNQAEFHCTKLTGTNDWKLVQYCTSFPADVFGAHIFFRNSGTGTVWFDDFKIEPINETTPTKVGPPHSYPLQPKSPEVVLSWKGQGTADDMLDDSGFGHHGKIYGNVAWEESEGRRALVLDGKSTYVWPLTSPSLALSTPSTMFFELKPESGGLLVACGFQFMIRCVGGPDRFAIEYEPAGGKRVASQPFLEANEWNRLALVFSENKVSLYLSGRLIEELPVQPKPFNWSLHTQSTWHRHAAFFGFGPGDMSLTADQSSYHLKGQLRSLVVFRQALADHQIQAVQK